MFRHYRSMSSMQPSTALRVRTERWLLLEDERLDWDPVTTDLATFGVAARAAVE